MIDLQHEDEIPEYERPNKSQLRREAKDLLLLAKNLVELHKSIWVSYQLSDDILDELQALKDISQHGAKKRQLKRVAKLLRDEDISAAKHAVENNQKQHADVNAAFHKVEMWRDRLIAGSKDDLTSFLSEYASANVQALNQLVRNAKLERVQNKPGKSSKLLFKLLREIME
jgi:ribosome-associated protein